MTMKLNNPDFNLQFTDQYKETSSSDNFFVLGSGSYGGDLLDWFISLDSSKLVVSKSTIGYAMGKIASDISSDDSKGLISLNTKLLDGSSNLYFINKDIIAWQTPSSWGDAGSIFIEIVANVVPIDDLNWNISASMNYNDDKYSFLISENDFGLNNNELLMFGNGHYGGNNANWWVSLDQSKLIYLNNLIGSSKCAISFKSTDNFKNGTLSYNSIVIDSDSNPVINSLQIISWYTLSTWDEEGVIDLKSKWDLSPNLLSWDVSSDFKYSSDEFSFDIFESSSSGGVSNSLKAYGNGEYSGNWENWNAKLLNSFLFIDSSLIGTTKAQIQGNTPQDWMLGNIIYDAQVKNSDSNDVLQTNGYTKWTSRSSWLEDGGISLNSLVSSAPINWNTSAEFKYSDLTYQLLIIENDFANSIISNDHFFGLVEGGYNFPSWQSWWLSITNSLIKIDQVIYANVRAYLNARISPNGENCDLTCNFADYNGAFIKEYSPDNPYPIQNTYLWTENEMSWGYDKNQMFGMLSTNSYWEEKPEFILEASLNVSFEASKAQFFLNNNFEGQNTLLIYATSDYDTTSGMINEMGGKIYYQDNLIIGINSDYDLQLQNYENPYYPTRAPTTPPTFQPTVAPSYVPTFQPTVVPNIKFSATQTLTGINVDSYNINQGTNDAIMKSSIAQCMTGVSDNEIYNLVITSSPSRRLSTSSSSNCYSNYDISLYSTTSSFASLSDQLQQNIENGTFNTYLKYYSSQYDTTSLQNVTSNYVQITDIVPSGDNKSLRSGAVAGIVIAVICVVGFVGFGIYYYFFVIVKSQVAAPAMTYDTKTPTLKDAEAIEMKQSTTGNVSSLENQKESASNEQESEIISPMQTVDIN